ncbi:MAG: FHA domain-containing protein [Myxococcota bacterium]
MRSPCVRLSLKGQTLADIPFEGDSLRIGRMKENDVVIHNLSVSRFHATLTREGDGFVIQDSGSENGIYVNGERHSRASVGPGDRILIGKHELEILPEGTADPADPDAGGSDAWDASNTYFVGVDTQAKMLQGAQPLHDADTDGASVDEDPETIAVTPEAADEPETIAVTPDAALEPETIAVAPEDADEPETIAITPEDSDEPETIAITPEDSDEPETIAAEPEPEEEPETVVLGDASESDGELSLVDPATPFGMSESELQPEPEPEPETLLLDADDEAASAELFGTLDEGDQLPGAAEEAENAESALASAEGGDDDEALRDPTREYDVAASDLDETPALDVALDEAAAGPEEAESSVQTADSIDLEEIESEPPVAASGTHAGLIISRRGRFERVLQWEAERLCLGRAVECDVVLSAAEVSRNHTLLVRDGDTYEVRDLESINGTWVNGEKISRRELVVGDVIRVDEFELTFVLENGPISDEIVAQAPEEIHAVPSRDAKAFTQLGEMLDLAPFDVGDGNPPAAEAAAMSFNDPSSEEPATAVLEDDPIDRSEGVGVDAKPADGVLALELKIRLEELPEPLREALRTLEESELRLPVELSLKTREG